MCCVDVHGIRTLDSGARFFSLQPMALLLTPLPFPSPAILSPIIGFFFFFLALDQGVEGTKALKEMLKALPQHREKTQMFSVHIDMSTAINKAFSPAVENCTRAEQVGERGGGRQAEMLEGGRGRRRSAQEGRATPV